MRTVPAALIAITAVLSLPANAPGQVPGDSLTKAIAAHLDTTSFSGVVLVAHRGQPIVEIARGQSNRAKSIANTPATRFQLASGDKWFTKIAISQLVDAPGKMIVTRCSIDSSKAISRASLIPVICLLRPTS